MAWPYHLLDITKEQKHERRLLLNRYGVFAQLSALVPILAYQLYRLGAWVYSERRRSKANYSAVLNSPGRKRYRHSTSGTIVSKWRVVKWWLEGEIASGWGLKGHWIAAGCWTTWLLFLCVHETGDDYLHITKRFGQVAASQFPLHYLLSMKSVYSPLAMAFQSSHEQLNPWHRLSGKIIYFLLLNHAMWYMNYFFQAGVVYKRLTDVVVIIGIVSFLSITVLATAALETVRRWSYRVFFVLHLFIGFSVLPILFCHTPELRFYTAESLAIFLFDLTFRKLDTVQGLATVTKVADTKLIKLEIPIPPAKLSRYAAAPGQHVYLNIPPESTPSSKSSSFIYSLLYNPFTVADVSSTSVTLVLRTLRGPATQAVNALASLTKANPPVNIEGPYGTSKRFPNLIDKYDRILLVAGGVGATFILPIYRDLRDEMESESISPDRLKLTWAMRSAAEAAWALDLPAKPPLEDDENVKIYFTRNNIDARLDDGTADGSVELQDVQEVGRRMRATGGKERPDLKVLVDEVFRIGNEERVAVLVCGPARMARELRKHVSSWVVKGREVWWHDETFGW